MGAVLVVGAPRPVDRELALDRVSSESDQALGDVIGAYLVGVSGSFEMGFVLFRCLFQKPRWAQGRRSMCAWSSTAWKMRSTPAPQRTTGMSRCLAHWAMAFVVE